MTLAERKLWERLRRLHLNIRRQAPIGRFVVDFVSHGARLVIEIDGGVHKLPEVQLRDLERSQWLQSQGYRVVRFDNAEVIADPATLAARIAELITEALPLDGGGLGGGVAEEAQAWLASAPTFLPAIAALHSPPSPALPPSRGKGG